MLLENVTDVRRNARMMKFAIRHSPVALVHGLMGARTDLAINSVSRFAVEAHQHHVPDTRRNQSDA